MMDIVQYGDPVLENKAEAVTQFNEDLARFVEDLYASMEADRGIGLAAPQVGRSIRVFVTGIDDDRKRVFINPEIVATSPELVEYEEGCLSCPGLYFMVKRPNPCASRPSTKEGNPLPSKPTAFWPG